MTEDTTNDAHLAWAPNWSAKEHADIAEVNAEKAAEYVRFADLHIGSARAAWLLTGLKLAEEDGMPMKGRERSELRSALKRLEHERGDTPAGVLLYRL